MPLVNLLPLQVERTEARLEAGRERRARKRGRQVPHYRPFGGNRDEPIVRAGLGDHAGDAIRRHIEHDATLPHLYDAVHRDQVCLSQVDGIDEIARRRLRPGFHPPHRRSVPGLPRPLDVRVERVLLAADRHRDPVAQRTRRDARPIGT